MHWIIFLQHHRSVSWIEMGIDRNKRFGIGNEGDLKSMFTKTNKIAPEHNSTLDQMKEELYKKLYDDLRKEFLNDLFNIESEIEILKNILNGNLNVLQNR